MSFAVFGCDASPTMSFLPTRSFAPNDPYITLHDEDGQERDLGDWDTRLVSPLSPSPEFRQETAEPPESAPL